MSHDNFITIIKQYHNKCPCIYITSRFLAGPSSCLMLSTPFYAMLHQLSHVISFKHLHCERLVNIDFHRTRKLMLLCKNCSNLQDISVYQNSPYNDDNCDEYYFYSSLSWCYIKFMFWLNKQLSE